jgi:hypothetical protein
VPVRPDRRDVLNGSSRTIAIAPDLTFAARGIPTGRVKLQLMADVLRGEIALDDVAEGEVIECVVRSPGSGLELEVVRRVKYRSRTSRSISGGKAFREISTYFPSRREWMWILRSSHIHTSPTLRPRCIASFGSPPRDQATSIAKSGRSRSRGSPMM